MPLSDIVNVSITRQTTAVSQAGFGTALIFGTHKRFNDRIRFYSNLSGVAEDFETTDEEYKAASNYFAQNPSPVQCAVGRRKVDDPVINTVTAADNFDYDVTINGTLFTYTSGVSESIATIALGIVTAIQAGSTTVTAIDNLDGTFDLDEDTPGDPWTLLVGANIATTAFTVTETIADGLQAVKGESDDWYGIIFTSRTQADVESIAAWVETEKKIFLTASDEANIIDTTAAADTTTIAAVLKAAAYARSGVIYSGDAANSYPEAALFGVILPKDPGSYTAMFKTLAGIPVDTLTATQSKNTLDKSANTYELIGGVNILRDGTVAEPEYIDVIIFVDWLQSRMTERIYSRLVNLPKIPFTDSGTAVIENEVRAQLTEGVNRGGLAEYPVFTVTIPKVADISVADKANRLLKDIKFTATLAGAIHEVQVQGVVTL